MRWSQAFIPTLRDDPAEAEAASHRLLLRGGFVRPLGAGIYSLLPLGQRVVARIARIVREEMDAIGGQEFHLPALHPADLWRESGRWSEMGDEMFRLQDRKGADLCLGMTHEEVFTALARDGIRSYRQLPQIWYQIQAKFRDEPRPKAGPLRARQFTMKDAYSFDVDAAGLDRAFDAHAHAYERIFARCGVEAVPVEAASGAMGGSASVEFMAKGASGEDWIVCCAGCGYAANREKAVSRVGRAAEPERPSGGEIERFPTPGVRTIEDLQSFQGGAPAAQQIKTLVYHVAGEIVLLLLRGDDFLNEVKVAEATGSSELRPGHPDEVKAALGARPGSLGAVGVTELRVLADARLRGARDMTTGANLDDFHLRHVDVDRDIAHARFVDLREVQEGEPCASCGDPLAVAKAIELGHIFKLGTRYSERMGACVLGPDGRSTPIQMGSYGIGLERLMAAIVETHHDADGMCWPAEVAPFHVIVSPPRANDEAQRAVADRIEAEVSARGYDVLLDDRDERAGVKFKDADLIGVPLRIVPGPRALAKGCVELVERASATTREVPLTDIVAEVARRLGSSAQTWKNIS